MSKNILFIVPSDLNDIVKKGVTNLILERDENGFFDNVLTLHPLARNNLTRSFGKNNKIVQYGWKTPIDFLNKFKIFKAIGAIIIFFKLLIVFPFKIKKEKISIIRATDPYFMGLIGWYYGKLFKIPVVVSIHSDYDKRYILDGPKGSFTIFGSRKFAKKLEKFVYKNVDMILPIREYMRKNIISEFNIKSEKVSVFPHGISFDTFDNVDFINIYQEFSINDSKKIISFVGRMSNENYIYDMIDSVKKLSKLRDDFILVFLGAGNEYDNIAQIVSDEKLEGIIKLVGFQPKNIVINTRKQSYASFCLMAGFSLIEACAARRPVISYDIEWHEELVKNDISGYLIGEGNIEEIVEKLDYLLDNPLLSDGFGKNAREISYKNHDIQTTTKIKQKLYLKAIN